MTDSDASRPADPTAYRSPLGGPQRRTAVVVLVAASTLLVSSVTALAATGGFAHQVRDRSAAVAGRLDRGPMMGGPAGGGPMGRADRMNGTGMMGGTASATMGPVWLAGNSTAVTSLQSARQRAAQAATSAGLHPGEVIWFDNGFYVELKDAAGQPATEVIVDPGNGAVTTEPGPAMMWNTRYGMMPRTSGAIGGSTGMMGGSGPGMMGGGYAGTGAGQTATVTADQARSIAQTWLTANIPSETAQTPDSYPGYFTMETAASGKTLGMLSVSATSGAVWYHTWHGRFIASEDA